MFSRILNTQCRWQMFFKISVLGNLFIKNIKKRLQHECFPENIAKFLKTAFLIFDAYLMT